MKAEYTTLDGTKGLVEFPVVLAQPMQHADGFALVGFESWEDVNDEKFIGAVTNLSAFRIYKDKIGFHADDKN